MMKRRGTSNSRGQAEVPSRALLRLVMHGVTMARKEFSVLSDHAMPGRHGDLPPCLEEIGRQPQMKEVKQRIERALSSLWKAEMEEDGSVVLSCDLFDSHPPRLTPNEAFALLDFLYEHRDVLCRQAYQDQPEKE